MRIVLLFPLLIIAFACPVLAQDTAPLDVQSAESLPQKPSENSETKAVEKVFNAETFTLENGLQIVVIPNHRTPVITNMVWYKVGAADEPWGQSGIAHFLEHLLFKGTSGLEPGEFSETIKKLGGRDNAFTSQDYTAYFQTVSSEHLETVMRMEAGRMRGLNPPLEEVESELLVIQEERKQRTDNHPRGRFAEQLGAAVYINHPYGIPVIGWMHEIQTLTWDKAKAFYDRWYAPNNAILIVSGDVTGTQVYDLAKEIYAPLKARDIPARVRPKIPPMNSDAIITLQHERIEQPSVQQVYLAPSYNQNDKDALALQVLEEIMGGGASSRFYKSIIVDQKLASSAGLSYNGTALDTADIKVYGSPLPDVRIDVLEDALEAEIALLLKSGVSETEVSEAVTRMQNSAIYARDSVSGPAMTFGYALSTGSSIDDIEYWPARIGKVTVDDVNRVARTYLNHEEPYLVPFVRGYLLPEGYLDMSEANDNVKENVIPDATIKKDAANDNIPAQNMDTDDIPSVPSIETVAPKALTSPSSQAVGE